MGDVPDRVYYFKHYRRTSPGGTTGELIKKVQIRAYGFAHAEQIAAQDYLALINFETEFVIIDGELGFATCWFTGFEHGSMARKADP